jgi:hypothetical protein
MFSVLFRILHGCTGRVMINLLRFAWRGYWTVKAFERRQRKGQPFFPAFLMLSITSRCNLRCRGCWVTPTDPPHALTRTQLGAVDLQGDTAVSFPDRFGQGRVQGLEVEVEAAGQGLAQPLAYPDIERAGEIVGKARTTFTKQRERRITVGGK